MDGSGRPSHRIALVSNITKSKQAKEMLDALNGSLVERTNLAEQRAVQIQQLAMELTKAEDRERQRLASILHDDFQQMLAYLKLQLSTFPRSANSGPKLDLLDRVIGDCIDRCRNLSHELKPVTSNRSDFPGALGLLCQRMMKLYGLAVALEVGSDAEIRSSVLCSLLIRSIRELLFNIVKHSGTNTAAIQVQRDGPLMEILISDDGKGCDPDELKGKRDRQEAFGLFDIEDRIRFLGGRMQVDTACGKGFCIRLRVPGDIFCASEKTGAIPAVSIPPVARDAGGAAVAAMAADASRPIRVLLADDHDLIREGLANLLMNQEGIEIVGMAADGRQAVALTTGLKPDVVLMDVSMPVMNGIDATALIVRAGSGASIIGLTMHDDAETRRAMLNAGACECLSKAISAQDLIQGIRTAFAHRHAAAV
jgi:CheY-like chemotaxis protein